MEMNGIALLEREDENTAIDSSLKSGGILLIDEDSDFQKYFRGLFIEAGVFCCGEGADGLTYAKRYRPDLIVMDVNLRSYDGFRC